jgi:hypothetical protein
MEMVRIALARKGLSVEEFKPITDMPVFVNDPCPVTREGEAGTRLVSIDGPMEAFWHAGLPMPILHRYARWPGLSCRV